MTAVWFHRICALGWVLLGAAAFPLHLADSIVLVWLASVYANVKSDWTAAEAADDRRVLDAVAALGRRLDRIEAALDLPTDPPPPR